MSSVFRILLRRLAISVIVLIGVSMLIFAIARIIPGDPARIALGPNANADQIASLRTEMHLDEPIIAQYGYFVADVMRGNLGQPPGGFPKGIVAKVLKGEAPNTKRPGKSLPPVDLDLERAKLSKELEGRSVDDEDLNGYLMYPKVFLDYMGRHRTYGPVRTLPTQTFFFGMEPSEEISDPVKQSLNINQVSHIRLHGTA